MRAFSKVPSTRAAVTLGLIVQDSAGPKERDCGWSRRSLGCLSGFGRIAWPLALGVWHGYPGRAIMPKARALPGTLSPSSVVYQAWLCGVGRRAHPKVLGARNV